MKKVITRCSSLLVSILMLSSCATMFGGSYYSAAINVKDHPDAEIYVNGDKAGKGVVTGNYKRNEPLVVEIMDEGCENKEQTFGNTIRVGNVILSGITFGLIGIGIDFVTGSIYKPDHKYVDSVEKIGDSNFHFQMEFDKCE